MNRREFLKKTAKYSVTLSSALALGSLNNLLGAPGKPGKNGYDVVAVKGGDPVSMFRIGIAELGGMKAFVKKGQSVVVKPNIGWDVEPEGAANTNPGLVAEIVRQCQDAGASKVSVFDHTCDNQESCYASSGIAPAAKKAGAKVVPGNDTKYYKKVRIPGGTSLTTARVHELITDSDVFINVPILKSHGSTRLTIAMKNLMGVVWERRTWHATDLHRRIAEFPAYRKPDLNVVDAYNVMMQNGPRGVSTEDVEQLGYQVLSRDIVAADAAAAKIFGIEPPAIKHIKLAHEMKIGSMDLESLKIKRIKL